MNELLELLRKKYTPEQNLEVYEFVKKLNVKLKKGEAMLGGSVAQETNLPGQYDADVFVRYQKEIDYDDLKNAISDYEYEVVHGSRDYFQIKKDTVYEIIPVLKVNKGEKTENVADMSPLHVNYFKEKTGDFLKSDIRLTKAFCKGIDVYGAESYVKGFSGHVLNILVIHYGSFEELLKKASKWKERTIIDIEKQLKNPELEIDKSKTEGPLIVVDPVYKYRNAAAALSKEKYDLFKEKAKEFLKNPSQEFFNKKMLKEKLGEALYLKFKPLKASHDVAGTKILKIKEYLEKKIKDYGFKALIDWSFEENLIGIKPLKQKISKNYIKQGPPLKFESHVIEFKQKYKKTFVEEGFIKAEVERKHTKITSYVGELIKNKYVKERCKEIKIK